LVVAETQSYKPTEVDVSNAGSVAIAMLQAEVHDPSNGQASQILVGEMGRLLNCRENIESGPAS